jgi:hypothetical protein
MKGFRLNLGRSEPLGKISPMRLRPRFTLLALMLAVGIAALLFWLGVWWGRRERYLERSILHASIARAIRQGCKRIPDHIPIRSILVGPSARGYFSFSPINTFGETGLDPVRVKALCEEYATAFERSSAEYDRAAAYPWFAPPWPDPPLPFKAYHAETTH